MIESNAPKIFLITFLRFCSSRFCADQLVKQIDFMACKPQDKELEEYEDGELSTIRIRCGLLSQDHLGGNESFN